MPATSRRSATCRTKRSKRGATVARSRSLRVLIVDDAPIACAVLSRTLDALGQEVVGVVGDGSAALDLVAHAAPDLVIIDGRLPPKGCIPLIEALRVAAPATLVAILASLAEIDLVRSAIAAGAAGVFRRPILRSQAAEALDELLTRRA